jgi:hypothetical protein
MFLQGPFWEWPMEEGGLIMINVKERLAALALGLAVTALASPSYAQRSEDPMSAARAAAVHECSVLAQKYPQGAWGDTQGDEYRTCMAEHGQPE